MYEIYNTSFFELNLNILSLNSKNVISLKLTNFTAYVVLLYYSRVVIKKKIALVKKLLLTQLFIFKSKKCIIKSTKILQLMMQKKSWLNLRLCYPCIFGRLTWTQESPKILLTPAKSFVKMTQIYIWLQLIKLSLQNPLVIHNHAHSYHKIIGYNSLE